MNIYQISLFLYYIIYLFRTNKIGDTGAIGLGEKLAQLKNLQYLELDLGYIFETNA